MNSTQQTQWGVLIQPRRCELRMRVPERVMVVDKWEIQKGWGRPNGEDYITPMEASRDVDDSVVGSMSSYNAHSSLMPSL